MAWNGVAIHRSFMTSSIVTDVAQHRVPLEGGVLGLGRHDGGEGLLGHVVLVHVALGQQAVAADRGQAVGRLVGAVAHLAGHRDHARGADARAGVVAAHAQHDLGEAGVDRERRLHGHERRGGAADGDRGEVPRRHPQVVRERRRVHQRQLDEGEGGDHPVHVSQRDPGVVERDLRDLGEELERARVPRASPARSRPLRRSRCPCRAFAVPRAGWAWPRSSILLLVALSGPIRAVGGQQAAEATGGNAGPRARPGGPHGRYATSAASGASRLVLWSLLPGKRGIFAPPGAAVRPAGPAGPAAVGSISSPSTT